MEYVGKGEVFEGAGGVVVGGGGTESPFITDYFQLGSWLPWAAWDV